MSSKKRMPHKKLKHLMPLLAEISIPAEELTSHRLSRWTLRALIDYALKRKWPPKQVMALQKMYMAELTGPNYEYVEEGDDSTLLD